MKAAVFIVFVCFHLISAEDQFVRLTEGEPLNLRCFKDKADVDVTWEKNGITISTTDRQKVYNTGDLNITSALPSDAGKYTCKDIKSTSTEEILVTYLKDLPASIERSVGQNFSLTCQVEGGIPSISWQKDNRNLNQAEERFYITSNSLSVSNVTANDTGSYECVVSYPSIRKPYSTTSKVTVSSSDSGGASTVGIIVGVIVGLILIALVVAFVLYKKKRSATRDYHTDIESKQEDGTGDGPTTELKREE